MTSEGPDGINHVPSSSRVNEHADVQVLGGAVYAGKQSHATGKPDFSKRTSVTLWAGPVTETESGLQSSSSFACPSIPLWCEDA